MSEDIINNGFLKLASAKICADCDTIYNEDFYKACPICTSVFFIRLYPVIHPLVELSESGELASCSKID